MKKTMSYLLLKIKGLSYPGVVLFSQNIKVSDMYRLLDEKIGDLRSGGIVEIEATTLKTNVDINSPVRFNECDRHEIMENINLQIPDVIDKIIDPDHYELRTDKMIMAMPNINSGKFKYIIIAPAEGALIPIMFNIGIKFKDMRQNLNYIVSQGYVTFADNKMYIYPANEDDFRARYKDLEIIKNYLSK